MSDGKGFSLSLSHSNFIACDLSCKSEGASRFSKGPHGYPVL